MNIDADGVFRNLLTNRSDFAVNRSPKVYLEPLKSHIFREVYQRDSENDFFDDFLEGVDLIKFKNRRR